jgi:putative flippase GtrA
MTAFTSLALTIHHWLHRWRYLKFGLVGASGTVVNLVVLYLCQEFALTAIEDQPSRLYASLAVAILVATINNFIWNRLWTWQDRQDQWHGSIVMQFARYGLASWLGTCVQYILTLCLAQHVHYLLGNVLAIVVASVMNYFANDWWTFRGNPREVSQAEQSQRLQSISLGLLVLAVFLYAFDLGGENIPRNGDELVYAHIAFKTWLHTQSTGAWLPLFSDIASMRNTKPPLLIWQAMAVPALGLEWQLVWLRLPSLLYTLANTALVVWATRGLAHDVQTRQADAVAWPAVLTPRSLSYIAGLIFLGCFSTYRYGRPYLTSGLETFWMNLPFWWLLAQVLQARQQARDFSPRASLFVLAALSWAMVAWYKSFVLIAPLAGTLFLSLCWFKPHAWWRWMCRTALSTAIAVAVFGLWFVVDPDPASVWREFVVGENWGKVNAGGPSYLQTAMVGGYSIWVQALGLLQNGAMLGPLIMAVMLWGLTQAKATWLARRQGISQPQAVLWLYVLLLNVFFMLPSQRSARYLIPLMPVVAVLCALWLWSLPMWAQRLTMGLGTLFSLVGLGFLGLFLWAGWRIDLYPLWGRLGLLLILALQVVALLRLLKPRSLHAAWLWFLGLVLSLFAWFGMLSAPLNAASNGYPAEVVAQIAGKRLGTPSNFNGDFERWRFLLPSVASVHPYWEEDYPTDASHIAQLLTQFDAIVVQSKWNDPAPDCQAAHCTVLAQRIGLRGRHKPGEISFQALRAAPEQVLFWHEYLIVPKP